MAVHRLIRADATECWGRVLIGFVELFRVREELDKTGGFFAPFSSCFYAKDDESASSAAHEFDVCTLLSASGFG